MGESITLKTFAVIVMGGMGNVRGTLLAGMPARHRREPGRRLHRLAVPRLGRLHRAAADADAAAARPVQPARRGSEHTLIVWSTVLDVIHHAATAPRAAGPRLAGGRLERHRPGAGRAAALAPLVLGDYYLHAMIIAMIFLLPAHGPEPDPRLHRHAVAGAGRVLRPRRLCLGADVASTSARPSSSTSWRPACSRRLIALPLGIPALRLRTTSFVMCTLGFVVIAQMVSKNWVDLTRGDMGLSGVARPEARLRRHGAHRRQGARVLLPDARASRCWRRSPSSR